VRGLVGGRGVVEGTLSVEGGAQVKSKIKNYFKKWFLLALDK
jgi:hypothetical protein